MVSLNRFSEPVSFYSFCFHSDLFEGKIVLESEIRNGESYAHVNCVVQAMKEQGMDSILRGAHCFTVVFFRAPGHSIKQTS